MRYLAAAAHQSATARDLYRCDQSDAPRSPARSSNSRGSTVAKSKPCTSTFRSRSAKPAIAARARIVPDHVLDLMAAKLVPPSLEKASAESKSSNAFPKNIRRRQQADHDVTRAFEIVKVSGLHQHVVLAQQAQSPRLLPAGRSRTIPLRRPACATRKRAELRDCRAAASRICRCTGPEIRAATAARIAPECPRKIRVGDDFEPRQRLADRIRRTVRDHPRQFHLRQSHGLRKAVQREHQAIVNALQAFNTLSGAGCSA